MKTDAIGTLSAETFQDADGRDYKLFTMACDASWRPVFTASQYKQNEGQFRAYLLDLTVTSESGVEHCGFFDLEGAKRYARSSNGKVNRVEPHWYVVGWGRVDAYR